MAESIYLSLEQSDFTELWNIQSCSKRSGPENSRWSCNKGNMRFVKLLFIYPIYDVY